MLLSRKSCYHFWLQMHLSSGTGSSASYTKVLKLYHLDYEETLRECASLVYSTKSYE